MKHPEHFKWFNILIVACWLICFSFIPHWFIFLSSIIKSHPVSIQAIELTGSNYINTVCNILYLKIFWRSFKLAALCTILCLFIAYPFSYALARTKPPYQYLLLSLVFVPFWTSSLIRTYAIISILKTNGILNTILLTLGIIKEPLQLLYTNTAVLIGLIYDLLPFMIIPLYTAFAKLNQLYINAARDLGASRIMILTRIIIPLTLPGILSGSLLVFLPAMTLFYIPDILGGGKSLLIGNLIQQQFLIGNWGLGGALSIVLLSLLMLLLWVGHSMQRKPHHQQHLF